MATEVATRYEVVVGLEVHAQARTRSKMFCGCDARYFDTAPNSHVCPVCLGMPGMLPVINRAAVEATLLTGLALGCTIPERAKFDRKNYPYPDLMKGYQISQYDQPLCIGGGLEVEVDGITRFVRLNRIHLEEDTARLLHRTEDHGEGYSLLDVNRAGVPLMEIVSEPDIRSAAEAGAYLRKLRQVLRYLGVSDADMEKGSFRCDANVSLRPEGVTTLGAKVEIKNMNSFRAVQRAIEYEIERQRAILDRGDLVAQETRGYVDADGSTVSQRSKEQAHDYRYFPEPDLPPLAIRADAIATLRERLPELPDAKRDRFVAQYGLTPEEARQLTETRERGAAFEETVQLTGDAHARAVSRWFMGDITRLLNGHGVDAELDDTNLTPAHLAELVMLVEDSTITMATAKEVLEASFESGEAPRSIVEARGLAQVRDTEEIDRAVRGAIEANPRAVEDYRSGKASAIQFLVGQVMRTTRGRADANAAAEILRRHLDGH